MPRTRKAKQDPASPDEDEGAQRPSQLEAIRAAMAAPPRGAGEDVPELAAPDEAPELEAHVEEPPAAAEPEPEGDAEPVAEPVAEPASAPASAPPSAPEVAAAEAEPVVSPWVPPPPQAPASAGAAAATRSRPGSSGLALGIVLVVVGVFFLFMRIFDVDLSSYGWPLYVIIPGLTLLVVGFISLGTGALVPGGIITMTGLVLAYQNATNDWPSWSYAWALVLPGGVGIGIFLQGLRDRDRRQMKIGRTLMFWALMIFLIGFVLFESILNVSGIDYGIVGRAALPVLLIVIGVTLLARSWQRSRSD